jgi:hypothetical protein
LGAGRVETHGQSHGACQSEVFENFSHGVTPSKWSVPEIRRLKKAKYID